MSEINLHLSDVALDRLLNSTTGPMGRHMLSIGQKIYAGAWIMAGTKTGALKRSLYVSQGRHGRIQHVEVGATVAHAYAHHEGTKPHLITPDRGRLLRFNVGGHVVYARKVHHPGTRARKYLTIPMRKAVAG